jgi:cob(I)alamin adenosyltransferase
MAHNHFQTGYIQVYTGNGKGKTTAAVGVSVRAVASGMKVFFGQFMKNTPSSEHIIFAAYPQYVNLMQFGSGKFVRGKPDAEDFEKAAAGWGHCKNALQSGLYDLVALDELNTALKFGLLPVEEVVETLRLKPAQTEVIITGRGAPEEIINIADLVTEMKEVKHYFMKGVGARRGIEE